MVGTSKILTVSYGTFSCTLEGFDDPFATMRGIAEYFRDLAADDRYFGAEPPTPDAEMLHRIAQREVHKRVEARVGDNGVVLRQMTDSDDEAAAEQPAAEAEAPAPRKQKRKKSKAEKNRSKANAKARVMAETAPQDAPAAAAGPALLAPATADIAAEDFAAKMLRIRAAVSRTTARDAYVEDQHADDFSDGSIDAAFADLKAPAHPVIEADEADEPETAPETTAEAAPQDEMLESAEYAEPVADQDANDTAEEAEADFDADAEADNDLIARLAAQSVPETEAPVAPVASDDAIASAMALHMDAAETEEEADIAPPAAETVAYDAPVEQPRGPRLVRARVIKVKKRDFDSAMRADASIDTPAEPAFEPLPKTIDRAALAEEQADDHVEDLIEDQIEERIEDQAEDLTAEDDAEFDRAEPESFFADAIDDIAEDDEDMDEADNAFDDDGAFDDLDEDDEEPVNMAGVFDNVEPEAIEDNIKGSLGASTLSEEEEAELLSELVEVEREVAAERHANRDGRALLDAQPADGGASVDRLLAETNSQLDDSENSRRRSTIAHLKAAVAATRADRSDTLQAAQEEELGRYREDLSRVVRPRHPVESRKGPSTERLLAPLMLVSEQRIDLPSGDSEGGVVRPRRITTGNLALIEEEAFDDEQAAYPEGKNDGSSFADTTTFAEFAAETGADTLPELLEAAAAHAIHVEGRPNVSRPHLMKMVADQVGADFSREEGLRAFGTLLRQGRILKARRGQFEISSNSRFVPGGDQAG